jgi:histidinol-phosphate aminotransferase
MRSAAVGRQEVLDALPIRDELRGLTAYGAPQLDVAVRLNTNENPYPMPPQVAAAIAASLAEVVPTVNRYPDRDAQELRAGLAAYLGHGLDVSRVWAANGSNEIQQELLQVFGGPGRRAMGFTPSYSMHRLLAIGTATEWVAGVRGADFGLTPDSAVAQVREQAPDVVFICAPNNPTGTALPPAVVDAVLDVAPGIVVVDEAYAEFRRAGTPTALANLDGHPRLVVTRTMSKAFACAGVRLGYLAASAEIVDAVQLVRLPYHLSALTQTAAQVALAHVDALLETVQAIKHGRDDLVAELRGLGLPVAESDANFVLFGGLTNAPATWRAILDRGVLVRDVGMAGWLRVTTGTPVENEAFLAAVRDVIAIPGTLAPSGAAVADGGEWR